jgi:hypothetical protein
VEELKLRYYELLIRYHEHQVRAGRWTPAARPAAAVHRRNAPRLPDAASACWGQDCAQREGRPCARLRAPPGRARACRSRSCSGGRGLTRRAARGAQDAYLEICRCYKAIAAMPLVAADAPRAADVLRRICWFVVLAPTSSDQARARCRGPLPNRAWNCVCVRPHQQRSGLASGDWQ